MKSAQEIGETFILREMPGSGEFGEFRARFKADRARGV